MDQKRTLHHCAKPEVRTLTGGQLDCGVTPRSSSRRRTCREGTGDTEKAEEQSIEMGTGSTEHDQCFCKNPGWEQQAVTGTPMSKTKQNGYVREGWRRGFETFSSVLA